MKILYIRANCEHANDMHINNVRAFLELSDVTFYGPGYTPKEILKKGVKWFWKEHNGYDAIIVDFFIAMLQSKYLDLSFAYHWHRYFLSDFDIHTAIRYADDIIKDVSDLDSIKIVQYIFDTVRFPNDFKNCAEELIDRGFFFWGPGIEFFPLFEETNDLKKCGYSNDYRSFCENKGKWIISIPPQTVDYREYYSRPLCERLFDFTVPGSLDNLAYPMREKVFKLIESYGAKIFRDYGNRELAYGSSDDRSRNRMYKRIEDSILDDNLTEKCIYIDSHTTRESRSGWQERYNQGIRSSKIAYADGGFAYQVLRKHVEICARGTLMICQGAKPLLDYGFINGINMIEVTEDTVVEKVEYFLNHIDEAQKIANQGQKMVFQAHTSLAHAKMLINTIQHIKNDGFSGSFWTKGEYVIRG